MAKKKIVRNVLIAAFGFVALCCAYCAAVCLAKWLEQPRFADAATGRLTVSIGHLVVMSFFIVLLAGALAGLFLAWFYTRTKRI